MYDIHALRIYLHFSQMILLTLSTKKFNSTPTFVGLLQPRHFIFAIKKTQVHLSQLNCCEYDLATISMVKWDTLFTGSNNIQQSNDASATYFDSTHAEFVHKWTKVRTVNGRKTSEPANDGGAGMTATLTHNVFAIRFWLQTRTANS